MQCHSKTGQWLGRTKRVLEVCPEVLLKELWRERVFLMCVFVWDCLGLRTDEWKACVSWASRRLPVIFFTRPAQSCPVCLRSLLINASVIRPEPGWSNPAEHSQVQPLYHPPPPNCLHPSQQHLTSWLRSSPSECRLHLQDAKGTST